MSEIINFIDFFKKVYPEEDFHLSKAKTLVDLEKVNFRAETKKKSVLPSTYVSVAYNGEVFSRINNHGKINHISKVNGEIFDPYIKCKRSPFNNDNDKSDKVALTNKGTRVKKGKIVLPLINYTNNYFHWIYETLPAIWLVQKSGISLDKIDLFIVTDINRRYVKETLTHLGIPERKIVGLGDGKIDYEKLIVVSDLHLFDRRFASWIPVYLKNKFLKKRRTSFFARHRAKLGPVGNYEKIYISRSKSERRRVLNEDKVLALLAKKGFKKVHLEDFTVIEQADILSRAKVVISPHGAGLVNIVFCKKHAKILELIPSSYISPLYYKIASLCELDYGFLLCDKVNSNSGDKGPFADDLYVNLNDLNKMLNRMKI